MPDSRNSQIIYPGSDAYSPAELSAPGTKPLPVSQDPIVRIEETAYILFQIPDLPKQKAFLEDFGMVTVLHTADRLFMRGFGADPFIYQAERGPVARFAVDSRLLPTASAVERLHQCRRMLHQPCRVLSPGQQTQQMRHSAQRAPDAAGNH